MKVVRCTNQEDAQTHAAQKVQERLSACLDTPTLLLLSGGSSLDYLSHIDERVLHADMVITVLDERFSTDPHISNFSKLTHTEFYETAKTIGAYFVDTRLVRDESNGHLAERMNHAVKTVLTANKKLSVIATIGIGADGHTAGMMPYPEDQALFNHMFVDTQRCFISYDAGTKNEFPKRVTATVSFLKKHVDHAVVYACGQEKKKVLGDVVEGTKKVHELPAQVLNEMKDVAMFTDIKK